MEVDKKQIDTIMNKLNQIDEIMNKLNQIDEIKEKLKQFDEIKEKLKQFDEINARLDNLEKGQEDIKDGQNEIKEEQRKMTIEMIKGFGKLEKKIDNNMKIVQRQINENNLKEEKRYQEQLELNEILQASAGKLENLAIQNIKQHETYDNILQIKCKTGCV